jgi:hypothetical protein
MLLRSQRPLGDRASELCYEWSSEAEISKVQMSKSLPFRALRSSRYALLRPKLEANLPTFSRIPVQVPCTTWANALAWSFCLIKILQILVEQCTHLPSNETKNTHTHKLIWCGQVLAAAYLAVGGPSRLNLRYFIQIQAYLQHIFSISAAYPTRVSDHLMTVGIITKNTPTSVPPPAWLGQDPGGSKRLPMFWCHSGWCI